MNTETLLKGIYILAIFTIIAIGKSKKLIMWGISLKEKGVASYDDMYNLLDKTVLTKEAFNRKKVFLEHKINLLDKIISEDINTISLFLSIFGVFTFEKLIDTILQINSTEFLPINLKERIKFFYYASKYKDIMNFSTFLLIVIIVGLIYGLYESSSLIRARQNYFNQLQVLLANEHIFNQDRYNIKH